MIRMKLYDMGRPKQIQNGTLCVIYICVNTVIKAVSYW